MRPNIAGFFVLGLTHSSALAGSLRASPRRRQQAHSNMGWTACPSRTASTSLGSISRRTSSERWMCSLAIGSPPLRHVLQPMKVSSEVRWGNRPDCQTLSRRRATARQQAHLLPYRGLGVGGGWPLEPPRSVPELRPSRCPVDGRDPRPPSRVNGVALAIRLEAERRPQPGCTTTPPTSSLAEQVLRFPSLRPRASSTRCRLP